jgi:DNA ligase (NAD+)
MGEIMKDFLDNASKAYYAGKPIISDAEFDILASHFNYKTVGHQITDGIPHFYRMYSLQNCFNLEDAPLNLKDCVQTPKLDGAAVSILYVGGQLSLALTRGDGFIGRDITDKVSLLVPNKIKRPGVVQINGEVVAPKHIENSRNFAAGSLNLKNVEEFHARPLSFYAYDISDNPFETWTEIMEVLELIGFNTVLKINTDNYPTDGEVYRVNDNEEFKRLGYTRHHPRGAFAHKIQAKGVETVLTDVIWQVGAKGTVSPVAILEPVKIGGATISRATLHNIKYIRDLDLEIGCRVEVIRSGEIIPRVVRRIYG